MPTQDRRNLLVTSPVMSFGTPQDQNRARVRTAKMQGPWPGRFIADFAERPPGVDHYQHRANQSPQSFVTRWGWHRPPAGPSAVGRHRVGQLGSPPPACPRQSTASHPPRRDPPTGPGALLRWRKMGEISLLSWHIQMVRVSSAKAFVSRFFGSVS